MRSSVCTIAQTVVVLGIIAISIGVLLPSLRDSLAQIPSKVSLALYGVWAIAVLLVVSGRSPTWSSKQHCAQVLSFELVPSSTAPIETDLSRR